MNEITNKNRKKDFKHLNDVIGLEIGDILICHSIIYKYNSFKRINDRYILMSHPKSEEAFIQSETRILQDDVNNLIINHFGKPYFSWSKIQLKIIGKETKLFTNNLISMKQFEFYNGYEEFYNNVYINKTIGINQGINLLNKSGLKSKFKNMPDIMHYYFQPIFNF